MLIKHYINLTNGIEALPIVDGSMSFLRIQSTTIERKDWASLFLVDCSC